MAGRPATSRRCSPSPTACAAATPTSPSPPSAPRTGSRPARPRARLPAARRPQGAAAAPALGRPAAPPGRLRGRGGRGRARHRPDRRPRRRRLRRLRLHARLPRGPSTRHTRRHPRAERPTRAGQPARCPDHAVRRDDLREHLAAARHADRDAVAPRDRASSTARPRAPRGWPHFGLDAHWPDRARHRRLARRPAAQRRPSRPARACCAPPGVQVLHVTGAGKEFVARGRRAGRALRRRALRRPDGPRVCRRRPRRRPRRVPTPSAS